MGRKFRHFVTRKSPGQIRNAYLSQTNRDRVLPPLLAQRIPLTWTNSSAGTRKSIYRGEADRAENGLDAWTSPAGESIYGCMDGYINLITTILTAWSGQSNASASLLGDVYTVTSTDSSNAFAQQFAVVGGEIYTFTFMAKKGTKPTYNTRVFDRTNGADVSFIINDGGSVTGASPYTDQINSDSFSFVSVTFTAPVTSIECQVYVSTSDSVGTVLIKDARLVQATSRYPAQIDGSAAGKTVAEDNISSVEILNIPVGSVVFGGIPYGYSGTANPTGSSSGKFFWADQGMIAQETGNITVLGNTTGVQVNDGQFVFGMGDWDGITHGAQIDGNDRLTRLDTSILLSKLYAGNRAIGERSLHGAVFVWLFAFRLKPYQYSLLRNYAIQQFGNVGELFK